MLDWIEEQTLIFWESNAKYILGLALTLSMILSFISSDYRDKFYESPKDKPIVKLEYKIKAKYTHRASKIVFISGLVLAFYSYRRKKKFYD